MPRRKGFSWKRASGLSAAKGRLSRKIGVPLTKNGRRQKVKRLLRVPSGERGQKAAAGCLLPAVVGVFLAIWVVLRF